MSENLIYADLNLTESTRPRLQKVTDVQGTTYGEVKVQSLDTNAAASYTLSGKSCCSRTHVAVLVAVIILLLVLVVCLILTYRPTASSPPDSKPSSTTYEEALGCPPHWEKYGGKCYFFSRVQKAIDWNASRREIRLNKNGKIQPLKLWKEMHYLFTQSRGYYYLLGLKFSKSEKKWKWINNMEHSPDMFIIGGDFTDYFCTVIGHNKVETASCNGSLTTQSMCEKAADISERQKES
ncbi:CLC5A protein, partial [Pandion haliaetus]|nr:CLC5A protein [Pandion haliaetus]